MRAGYLPYMKTVCLLDESGVIVEGPNPRYIGKNALKRTFTEIMPTSTQNEGSPEKTPAAFTPPSADKNCLDTVSKKTPCQKSSSATSPKKPTLETAVSAIQTPNTTKQLDEPTVRKPTRPRKLNIQKATAGTVEDAFLDKIKAKCGSLTELLSPKKPIFMVKSAARFKTGGELRKQATTTEVSNPHQCLAEDLTISSDEEDGELINMLY